MNSLSFLISLAATVILIVNVVPASTIDDVGSEADSETERIVGGRPARPGQFPWMVALFYHPILEDPSQDQFICGASIISPTTLLTSAHCVVFNGTPQEPGRFHGIANVNRNSQSVQIDIVDIDVHPDYNDINHDIAVLSVDKPIMLEGANVSAVCIARQDTPPMEYKHATIMGWGSIFAFPSILLVLPYTLKYAEEEIVTNDCCAYYNEEINDGKICARAFGSGICLGDSGGPLVHMSADKRPVQIGIASYLNSDYGCGLGSPGVFARVSSYHKFIMDNSKNKPCVV